jgi:hypothetical protein
VQMMREHQQRVNAELVRQHAAMAQQHAQQPPTPKPAPKFCSKLPRNLRRARLQNWQTLVACRKAGLENTCELTESFRQTRCAERKQGNHESQRRTIQKAPAFWNATPQTVMEKACPD